MKSFVKYYQKSEITNTKQNGYPIGTCAKFSEKLTFHFLLRTCAYQGVINVSFGECFAYALTE